jgi:hypothetical protein
MQQYLNSVGFNLLMIGGVIASVAYLVVLFVGWLLVVQP